MAPIRRYLRITKYSVLEVRIYLDRPADADAWLLRRDDPALPRVIQAVRPLVLPKLREENERGRSKAKTKKKGVKDVVVEDDFEVSIFLTELSSRHSVMIKQKAFKDKPRIQSNSAKLTSWLTSGTSARPMLINEDDAEPIVIREEDDDEEGVNLADIPEAVEQPRSARQSTKAGHRGRVDQDITSDASASDSDSSALFVPGQSKGRTSKVTSKESGDGDVGGPADDKKKLSLNTSYEGFSIYGRILCLVVKRRGARSAGSSGSVVSSQQMLEDWVSTQAAAEQVGDDEDGA